MGILFATPALVNGAEEAEGAKKSHTLNAVTAALRIELYNPEGCVHAIRTLTIQVRSIERTNPHDNDQISILCFGSDNNVILEFSTNVIAETMFDDTHREFIQVDSEITSSSISAGSKDINEISHQHILYIIQHSD